LKRYTVTDLWNKLNICWGGGGRVNGTCNVISRSQWPYGLRHRQLVWVLRLRTRIPLWACSSIVFYVSCIGSELCDAPISLS
jgi:hypothetical protein